MKSFFSFFYTLLVLFTHAQNYIDVLHYRYEIKLNDDNDTIYGKAEITVKFRLASQGVSFDFANMKTNGKGMKIDSINSKKLNTGFSISSQRDTINGAKFIHRNDKTWLIYSSGRSDGADKRTVTDLITIYYHGIPADGLIISKTKYGRRSFFADNWPDRARHWLPCHDDPADKASVEFITTAPEHYQVVANGIQIEESSGGNGYKLTHWKEDTPVSTKVMTIGVADFAVNLSGIVNDCIPVYSWVYPEDRDKGFFDYELAKDILPFFIGNVGPYGYKKLANVQSRTRFGGLENANTIFYSESSVTGTRENESLLAHEIAHQWFGNMATEKSFGHLWLSEGFATYFTILYFENKYGRDTALKMLQEGRDQVIAYSKTNNRPVVDTIETDYMELLNPNPYQKGGWVLHMLRKELGYSVFLQSIRKYYSTYAGSIADTEDLRKIFEEISGKDLRSFFRQWLYTASQPDIDVVWNYDNKKKNFTIAVRQKQKELFYFPLDILIRFPSGLIEVEKLIIDSRDKSFTFSFKEKPASITTDPETSLLFESSVREIK